MTIYTPNSSGNWNTASIWDTVAQIPTVAGSVNVTTAGLLTDTWTAPNTTNFITGAWICMLTTPAAGRDFTLELFQSGVATGNITTFLQTDMPPGNGIDANWIYFRLAVPFQYTTTAAGAYRFQIKSTVANSGAVYNSSGATVLILPTDDRHAVPSGAHQVWIGSHNGNTNIAVTVDGTSNSLTGGTGAGGTEPLIRSIPQHSVVLGGSAVKDRATLVPDPAADSTLAVSGNLCALPGGGAKYGTAGSPLASGVVGQLNGQGAVNVTFVCIGNGNITGYSARTLTYTRTTYASGLGTAANPLILADPVDWNVGDKIVVGATTNNVANYNESEVRFIITKNSTTSYVVSNTKGGSENALVNTHSTDAVVAQLTRGVSFQHIGGSTLGLIMAGYRATAPNDSGFGWAALNSLGSVGGTPNITSANSWLNGLYFASGVPLPVDNCVFDDINSYGFICNNAASQSYDSCIFSNSRSNSGFTLAGLGVTSSAVSQTFNNPIFINLNRQGCEYRGVNCNFVNPIFVGCNKLGTANQGAFNPVSAAPFNMTNPQLHCNRIAAYMLAGSSNSTITGGAAGTKGYNGADVSIQANTANSNILFDSFTPGSTTFVLGHTSGAIGATELLFSNLAGTTNRHMWFTEYGSAQSTGAGLPDTTVRTPGTLNVRMNPENSATGFQWEYLVPAVPGKAVQSFLFIEKNATFGTDVATVELFLPGSTVADATATVSNTTGSYLVYSVAAPYLGSTNQYARIRITAKSVAAGAYLYLADISNGTNDIINLKTWYRAKPSSIMFEQLGDAGAVWAYLIENGITARECLLIYNAVLAGRVTNADTNNEHFRNLANTLDRLVNTVDASGNRSNIVLDLS